MEKRKNQLEHGQQLERTRCLFCMCDSGVARCHPQHLNEFGVRSVLHGQVSLAAVSQICVTHEAMNGCKNQKDSLKSFFEIHLLVCSWNHKYFGSLAKLTYFARDSTYS